ncbi:hypothetical protein HNY73_009748 [Argiope bruennichi]|uniref:Uncharacterized protein n=1 Tax=Argiope bruennichi TaxID=94029 RepID=A0A8T0FAD6_ARGBR|nr:hypothetical protein HNY73_009748 [Argiope bruennichi]
MEKTTPVCKPKRDSNNKTKECWKLGLSWDAELPLLITERFERWKMKLPKLNDLEIPRCVREDFAEDSKFSIHVFCDASQSAYATCIFLRAESADSTSVPVKQARNRKENWATFVYTGYWKSVKLTNPEDWRHIKWNLNPADLPSRGSNAEELVKSLWWKGPNWLRKPIEVGLFFGNCARFRRCKLPKKENPLCLSLHHTEQLELLF